jgi:6-phosphofructokinase
MSSQPNKKNKLLVIFDGGNAPGYTTIATSVAEEGIKRDFEVYAAYEGFRSIAGDSISPHSIVRLVMDRKDEWGLNSQGIPTRSLYQMEDSPGSEFRSERYPSFSEKEKQLVAKEFILESDFTHIIGVGGNGTLYGLKALANHLPDIQIGFLNVSIDSDIIGDISTGYMTGVEEGAKIARGLMADAFTHKRIYILEMMGRDSGSHALMSGASARAHLIILPGFEFKKPILSAIAKTLNSVDHALVIVAEGYKRKQRAELKEALSASDYFKRELLATNLLHEGPMKKITAEPFSRYIRGVRPLSVECAITHLKVIMLFDAFAKGGESQWMPYYTGKHDAGMMHFDELVTNNRVLPNYLDLIDRFNIPELRDYIVSEFKDRDDVKLIQ